MNRTATTEDLKALIAAHAAEIAALMRDFLARTVLQA